MGEQIIWENVFKWLGNFFLSKSKSKVNWWVLQQGELDAPNSYKNLPTCFITLQSLIRYSKLAKVYSSCPTIILVIYLIILQVQNLFKQQLLTVRSTCIRIDLWNPWLRRTDMEPLLWTIDMEPLLNKINHPLLTGHWHAATEYLEQCHNLHKSWSQLLREIKKYSHQLFSYLGCYLLLIT